MDTDILKFSLIDVIPNGNTGYKECKVIANSIFFLKSIVG